MSSSSSVPETTSAVPGTGSETQTITSSGASNAELPHGATYRSTYTFTRPERKTLVLMEMSTNDSETTVRELFADLKQGSVSGVEVASSTYFVTFSSGDAATEAFGVANSKSLSVKFKTTSSNAAPLAAGATSTPYYAYPAVAQDYTQYWEPQTAYGGASGASDVNGQFYRGGPRGASATHIHNRVGASASGFAASGATGTSSSRVSGHPKSKGPRGPVSAQYASSGSVSPSNDAAVSGNAVGAGATAPHSPTQRSGRTGTAPARHTSGGSPTTTNTSAPTHVRAGTGAARRNGANGQTSGAPAQRRPERTNAPGTRAQGTGAHKGEPKDKPNLSLASFPPLVHPSGSPNAAAAGYGTTYQQYSRETILAAAESHDATKVQRPAFDNADAPILLTSPQLDFEVNKPLPVGAKFEPLATDKRTRSLSKKSDSAPAPPQPTTAQIIAAAAAKAQQHTTTVKVVSAKPATVAPAKTQAKKEDAAQATHTSQKSVHAKKPASPTAATNATATAPHASPATTAAPAVLSWADRARAPAAPVEPKKKIIAVEIPAVKATSPATETPTPVATAPIDITPTATPADASDATDAIEAK